MRRLSCLLVALLGAVISAPAWSARPFVTDDARLTTAGSCQLESWTRLYRNSTELWALPACNPTGNLELTVGGGTAKISDTGGGANGGALGGWTDDYVFQAKTLFKPLTTNGWGAGIAAGTIRHPQINPGPNLLGNTYVYLPLSLSFADDRVVIHLNTGWLKDKATLSSQTTWGIGSELNVSPRWTLVAETFGNTAASFWQGGVRYNVIPSLFQLDTTAGSQLGGNRDAQWISFGLRFTPASLF
ncbi:MAG: hypothetical protein NBV65_11710 [Burkholderiaceae bacterium]|nr:hypothetical protein [Burkholderiaceae bacterium]